ncbi:MAG TPA: chemotaxis protein CheW [Chloroflexota bacterium]|jgi:purine-binding chemotaxis protein CheW|nr:chemotaxis protein CheW [Chloroflexota bacterium]
METAVAAQEEQVVVLELAGEAYGVEIGRVQEIIRMQPITRVPNGPACFEGVTNLRGRVIPVLDLRKRFGLEPTPPTRRSRIVVAELGEHTVGLVVDAVSEVLRVPAAAVEPPSALVTTADSAYLRGVAKLDERLVLLLDLARILAPAERAGLEA